MNTNRYNQEIVAPGDKASKLAKEICFSSHSNCPAVDIIPHQPGNFRGAVGYRWKKHILQMMLDGKMTAEVENDGAGGKPQFFTLGGTVTIFTDFGWEIITMSADDFARSGRFPAIMANDFNVKAISDENFELVRATFTGYGKALKAANLVNITGEIAVMKHSITAFCDLNDPHQLISTWGGTCIGLAHEDRLINGSRIKPGMYIIGLWEPGYRCNGGTFFTNLILKKYGPNIQDIINNPEAMAFVKALTVPSMSYAKSICRIIGWDTDGSLCDPLASVAGIAHISGGGVWGKFGELLPEGIGAQLHSMPQPAKILRVAQELSWDTEDRLTDYQAYGTLHGGCGMLIVVNPQDSQRLIDELGKDNISASLVGTTIESEKREITIQSRFKTGELLSSLNPN